MTTGVERIETTKLVAGELCLDFANTASRRTVNSDELLCSYEDLVFWFHYAGMLSEKETERLQHVAARQSTKSAQEFQRALVLREAVYKTYSALASERPPSKAALKTINAAATEMLGHLQISPSKDRFEWTWYNVKDALEFPLWTVARSATRLLVSEESRRRVRECQGRGCHWLFVDQTCNRNRRWCDMATCGNREKVRQFRARKNRGA
ncbi:ABATE domain-containing protein [Candidatus Bipolaricaulota bacterium]|nr:ABATE domain-containing protein [Candidatus Bipolaricaulota bacterium]